MGEREGVMGERERKCRSEGRKGKKTDQHPDRVRIRV